MKRRFPIAIGVLASIVAAYCLAAIALTRGEPVNSAWILGAAGSFFFLGFRFYSRFIAAKVMALDDTRATPAERLRDGHDYEPTNKWIVFGHHFAAIAGPGPLVGPTLAAQFGYLPGLLWILFGCVLAGAVQDFVILFCSLRRDGRTLGEMAREEIGPLGGFISLVTVLLIMVILLAVVGLVVVNALKNSPWGAFTISMTLPIALSMGVYLRFIRPGKVLETSLGGFVLLLLSIFGGQWVSQNPSWASAFSLNGTTIAVVIIVYGFCASVLPVWLVLAPRDYLSTFVKLGVVFLLAIGIFVFRPELSLPAFTRFTDGTGPVFAGKVFPFCFITIACGAISGFHSLISSGTTPRMIAKESHARQIGYGSMLLEGFVGLTALIAAASLAPGIYFAVNSPSGIVGSTAGAAVATISGWGFPVTADEMSALAKAVGESTLFGRTGGAPSLALGMAHIFGRTGGGSVVLSFWYHFAIMFEALFILTILDAGTRVGRFMLQDFLGNIYKPLGRSGWMPAVVTSGLVVGSWGYFLYQGVLDPLGGINSLWPLFGIANQLLASIALCVATTILLKMHRLRYIAITALPLLWLLIVNFTAGIEKIFSTSPRLGFLASARVIESTILAGGISAAKAAELKAQMFNERLDAIICGVFLLLVALIVADSLRVWIELIRGSRQPGSSESPFVLTQLEAEEL